MREMTDAELSGAVRITDDMLVLGDLAELPAPGDEEAAIRFVAAMIERAVIDRGAAEPSPHTEEGFIHAR